MHSSSIPAGSDLRLGPTLARIFVAGLLAGGLASRLAAAESPAHAPIELALAPGIEDDDDYDPDGGTGTAGRSGGRASQLYGDDSSLDEDAAPMPRSQEALPRPPPPPAPAPMGRPSPSLPGENSRSPLRQRPKRAPNGREVAYHEVAGQRVTGYLATPDKPLPGRPAVVVIHEWWGLNDRVRQEADGLAEQGYLALAVDLYRGKRATSRKMARALLQRARRDLPAARANLLAGLRFLRTQDAGKVGALGWSLGGTFSLQLALAAGSELDAAVMVYGLPVREREELAALRAPLLGFFAEHDEPITGRLPAFRAALDDLGKPHAFQVYPGARHGFADPNNENHNVEYARDVWKRTLRFLRTFLVEEE